MNSTQTRLRTVLKVRKYQEKKAQAELIEIQEHHHQEAERLEHLKEETECAMEESISMMRARATELQASRAFIQSLSRQIERQQQKIETLEEKENDKREELTGRSQSRKMVEILEERREEEVEKERDRKEQRLIDVLAHRIRLGF